VPRFNETVNIQQAGTINYDSSSLTNKLDAFANQQTQVHAQKTAQRAFASGQTAFIKGEDPEFKEERFFGGVASSAYNKGLMASYVSSIDADNRLEIARIAAENPQSISAFNDNIESYRKATLTNVDPSARNVVADSMDSLINANRIKVQNNEIAAQHKESDMQTSRQIEAATTDALGFARDGDATTAAESALAAFATIDARVESGFINSAQGAEQKRDIEKGLIEEGFKGDLFRTFDSAGAGAAFDKLDDMKRPKGFAPEEWDSFVANTQTDLNRKLARQQKEEKANLKAIDHGLSVERGRMFSNPDIPADPAKNSQDRKDVNAFYDQESAAWEGLPAQQQVDNIVGFIKNTGLVPERVISTVNATSRSGNPDQVMMMVDVVSRVQELPTAANALRDLPDESRAFSLQVADATRSGVDPEQAIEIARKNTYGMTAQQKEAVKIQAQAESKNLAPFLKTEVDRVFDPSPRNPFDEEPEIPVTMQADFNVAFSNFMTLTDGNPDQAKKLAFGSLRKTWAVTGVDGKDRFMKSAPEAFYSIDGIDDKWMGEQFAEDMMASGIVGAEISSDFNTGRSNKPSYPVMVTNAQGFVDVARNPETGNVLRWQPDFTKTQEYSEAISAPENAIISAKEKRAIKMARRANVLAFQVDQGMSRSNEMIGMTSAEKAEFLASPESKPLVSRTINNMLATKKIDKLEADELRNAFEVE